MQWETVIGLEVHVQLATQSKIFSGAAVAFGAEPNTQACAVDLAMPGMLPVVNEEAIRMAIMFGLGIEAEIGKRSAFDRKNYFYPDSPKGYQISQFEFPIVGKGSIHINLENGKSKKIAVTRAHLEEDAGKSLHESFKGMSGIDLNRAGTPLLEIVSEPDIRNSEEAIAYLKTIHSLITYLGISDGNMAEGSMRCDINISLRPKGSKTLGTRAEIKNVNSFRFVERAIKHEFERQSEILEDGGHIIQETRLYDADRDETRSMRSKEIANDYRYFPEPDLLPIEITDNYIQSVRNQLPELPQQKQQRFIDQYKLSPYDAMVLSSSRQQADYFEAVVSNCGDAKLSANWVMVELTSLLKKDDIEISSCPISSIQLSELISLILDSTISGKIAKQVFQAMWNGEGDANTIIKVRGLKQVSNTTTIETMINHIVINSQTQVAQYLAADEAKQKKLLGYFIGKVMKASKGQANPAIVNQLLKQKLK